MFETSASGVQNPYPGLRPFRVDERHLFFGRERQVDRRVEKLAAHRFPAVVGSSGSGKSSLVNCGLRPALHRGNMAAAGSHWRMAQMRPGNDPIGALARALAEPGVLFDEALGDAAAPRRWWKAPCGWAAWGWWTSSSRPTCPPAPNCWWWPISSRRLSLPQPGARCPGRW